MKRLLLSLAIMVFATKAFADDPYSKLIDACLRKDSKITFCDQMLDVKDHTQTAIQDQLVQWGLLNASVLLGSAIKSAIDQKVEISDKTHTIWVLGNERKVILKQNEISIVFVWTIP